MTVQELIDELKKQNPKATVWIDWDIEGGNESEVSRIAPFNSPYDFGESREMRKPAIKLK